MQTQIKPIALALNVSTQQVEATLKLLEEGNTIPFIARYRKEMTRGLDEEQILYIDKQYQYQVSLLKRKEDVKRLIAAQDKLTDELSKSIDECETLTAVEDIYRPYQQKRKTRATDAIAKGLKPLAEWILACPRIADVNSEAKKYLSDTILSTEEAIQGALDIIAEFVSENAELRKLIREMLSTEAKIIVKLKKNAVDEAKVYRNYYAYTERVTTLASHRIMAIDRGEKEKILDVSLDYNKERFARYQFNRMTFKRESSVNDLIDTAIKDALKRLVYPSLERELRAYLTEKAQDQSIHVFSNNLERLLAQTPMKESIILGFDPAYRTGCKLAVVDSTGKLLHIDVIYPHAPVNKLEEASTKIISILEKYKVNLVAIGNGTASRESESFVANIIQTHPNLHVQYVIVSEAGASVYSASELARQEFPDLHVEERSAVSIARRLLDPLSELIKIDPKSIGVGQYQHDLPAASLEEQLNFTLLKIVNRIGTDVNTASEELLRHIAGLNRNSAKSIVQTRNTNGLFKSRKDLLKVKGLGEKAFEQAAGFLRIAKAQDELDQTAIHPESYDLTKKIMKHLNIQSLSDEHKDALLQSANIEELKTLTHADEYTIVDILSILKAPLRDYRESFDGPLLKSDILKLSDLKENLILEGTVRNVVDFGAFVDIGLKNDGLIHISKMGKIKSPYDKVSVGDIVSVEVLQIDEERQKVSLALIED